MPFGSPGNDVQPQAMTQVLLNIFAFGMTPQDAVEQPRFASFSYPRSSNPNPYSPGLMNLEGRFPEATVAKLRALGHDVALWPDWDSAAGAVCAILHDQKAGTMEGGSDPRRPTAVAGW
jgi:gamma-glutamyltranspeptidase/glutathione hydrolase